MNFPHIYPPTSPTCKTRFAGADAGSSTQDKNLIWLHHRLLPRSITYSWPMVKILMLCNYLHSAHTQKGLAARRLAGSAPRNFLEWPQGFQNARLRLLRKGTLICATVSCLCGSLRDLSEGIQCLKWRWSLQKKWDQNKEDSQIQCV